MLKKEKFEKKALGCHLFKWFESILHTPIRLCNYYWSLFKRLYTGWFPLYWTRFLARWICLIAWSIYRPQKVNMLNWKELYLLQNMKNCANLPEISMMENFSAYLESQVYACQPKKKYWPVNRPRQVLI